MPVPRSIRVLPAAGSINTGAPPSKLADNEYQDLLNYYPYASRLVRRGGSRRLNATPFPEQITRIKPHLDADGGWHMLIGGLTKVAFMEDDLVIRIPPFPVQRTELPFNDRFFDTGLESSLEPWGIATRNDLAYFYRSDRTPLKLNVKSTTINGALWWAGVTRPLKPVLSDGGAGTLAAATWRGVIVFYTVTGDHSEMSEVSDPLVLGSSKKVKWDWTAPLDGAVTKVGLFRSLPDQEGAFYRVALVDASLITYTEDTSLDGMGEAAVRNVTVPQRGWFSPVAWKERLWATDGNQVYPSQLQLFETFNLGLGRQVGPNDGAKIVGLYPEGDRLYVLKENAVYFITGDGPASWSTHELDRQRGGIAGYGIGSYNGTLIFPGWDALYTTAGAAPAAVKGGIHTKALFEAIDLTSRKNYQAAVVDPLGLYILLPRYLGTVSSPLAPVNPDQTRPGGQSGFARRAIVYSFLTGDVSTFRIDIQSGEGGEDMPIEIDAITSGPEKDGQPGVWIAARTWANEQAENKWWILTFMDDGWPWDDLNDPDGTCDDGNNIPRPCNSIHAPVRTRWTTKSFGAEGAALVGLLRLWLLTNRGTARAALIKATPSGTGGMSAERTIQLPGIRDWQAYSLPTRQSPADGVAVTMETAAAETADIDGFMVELVDIIRSARAK